MKSSHTSVLEEEVVTGLAVKPADTVLDGTAGGGGHALRLAAALTAEGTLVAIDRDPEAVERVRERLSGVAPRVFVREGNYRDTPHILTTLGIARVDRILLDLGLSSDQLEHSGRGFTFQKDEPLHMAYAPEQSFTAADIVNGWSEEDIANVLFGYGEERAARKIAKALVAARREKRIERTKELVAIIERVLPRRGKTHPATKTFQALRIAVNDELTTVRTALPLLLSVLSSGGRLAVINFHSLEDRIVKDTFRSWQKEGKGMVCTKKPILPARTEYIANPRSRSAKLRIFEKQ